MKATIALRDTSGDYAMACPNCGTTCQALATSRPEKRHRAAVIECATCGASWTLEITVRTITPGRAQDRRPAGQSVKCGTNPGYVTHVKRGESPCPECRKAHNLYQQQYRKAATAA